MMLAITANKDEKRGKERYRELRQRMLAITANEAKEIVRNQTE